MFVSAPLSSILDAYQASIAAAGPLYCIRRLKFACCSVPIRRSTPTETVLRLFGVHKQGELEGFGAHRLHVEYPAAFLHHP